MYSRTEYINKYTVGNGSQVSHYQRRQLQTQKRGRIDYNLAVVLIWNAKEVAEGSDMSEGHRSQLEAVPTE